MEPPVPGWLTIICAASLLFAIVWRVRSKRRRASILIICSAILFVFWFMQWASWYK